MLRAAGLLALALLTAVAGNAARAAVIEFCDSPVEFSTRDKDRLLRLGAVVRETLEASGQPVALVSRSGMDLSRFGLRYTHTGISLKANPNTRWSVRQLYYSCDERLPKIFDQGLAAFVLGFDDPSRAFVSVVLLPPEASQAVEQTALDARQALAMLNPRYSANAYPFSDLFQNCNQWVVEMLAAAWGKLSGPEPIRRQAQAWLADRGYRPTRFDIRFPPPAVLSALVPWLHFDDHPPQQLRDSVLEVSTPAALERFAFETVPGARRVEFCSTARHIVVRRGWTPIEADCQPGRGDEVIPLD